VSTSVRLSKVGLSIKESTSLVYECNNVNTWIDDQSTVNLSNHHGMDGKALLYLHSYPSPSPNFMEKVS